MNVALPADQGQRARRLGSLATKGLDQPAVLIFNPNAGEKLGLSTNAGGPEAVHAALTTTGIPFDPCPTERAGHATELAREAVAQGRQLVIAAGGDGTVGEVAQALANTDVTLGIMPLGSIMNVARTLAIPRELPEAAEVIARGQVLTMDLGKVGGTYFLEAAGVGLDAGLYGYFARLDSGASVTGVAKATVRFLRNLGTPRLVITADGRRLRLRAPLVTIANAPYCGAPYTMAPDARIDDGLLDVVIFRGAGVLRVLFHLAVIAGGRRLPPPPEAQTLRVRSIKIDTRRRRTLPVHADGSAVGATPAEFEAVPGALKVLVGSPDAGATCSWERAQD